MTKVWIVKCNLGIWECNGEWIFEDQNDAIKFCNKINIEHRRNGNMNYLCDLYEVDELEYYKCGEKTFYDEDEAEVDEAVQVEKIFKIKEEFIRNDLSEDIKLNDQWETDEAEADEDIQHGRLTKTMNPQEAIEYLNSLKKVKE